ncbi:MAG: HEAT repeat domain-containing protein, partial [Myxococcota bacterium]
EERKLAVTGLPYTRSKTALDVVLKRTAFDGNTEVRRITVEGLGFMGLPEAVPILKDVLLKFGDKQFQYAAIASLGRIKSPKAAEQLKYKAFTPDLKMKQLVFEGLERLKQPNTVDIIERLTTDTNSELRWRATLLLIQLNTTKGMAKLDYALQRPPQDYIISVVDLPQESRDAVLDHMLRHKTQSVREEALSGVSMIGFEGVKLMRAIAYKDATVTNPKSRTYASDLFEAAFTELLRQNSDQDLGFFMRIAQTGSEDRKIQALSWLTRRASKEMVPRFRTLMKGSKSNKAMYLAAINGLLRSEA